jgi:phage-related protein
MGISYEDAMAKMKNGTLTVKDAQSLLGTTAKEASTTIEGSLSSMKGAWSNLLTAMSTDDLPFDEYVTKFVDSVSTVAENIMPRVQQALEGVVKLVDQLAPIIIEKIPGLVSALLPALVDAATGLVNSLVAALPGVITALMDVLPMLIDGVMSIVDALIGALPTIMETIVNALPTIIPQLIDAAVSLFMMLVEMLPQIIQPLIDALPTIIIGIVEALVNNLPALIQGAIQLIMGIVQAIPQIIQALVDAIPTIVSLLTQAILNNLPAIIMGLIQVVTGIVVALPQIFSSLLEGVVNIFTGIWDGIKNVFSGLGEWFSNIWSSLGNVPGLAQMKEHIETVWGAIKSHISTVINAIKNVISSVWNSIKNVVSTVLNSIKNVIQTAWNAVKTIISNVMKLISSVLKGDWEGVKKAISNILNAIKSVIKSVWDGIKNTISSVLNGIKNVVSSIWDGIKSVISSALNTIKTVVSSAWNNVKSAISNILTGIINTVKGAAKNMLSAGKDLVKGIWNGISGAYDWIKGKIKGWVGNVTKFFKKLFGIKSPSTVMRDEVGKFLAEGVAVGIDENTKEVESSSEKMAKKVLEAAQKRLDDYKIYNDLALSEEVAFWDSVRKQVAEGTDARISADQKYLEAKKSLDDQILSAEETLQSELDEIAKRITDRQKELMDTYDLFGGFDFKAKEEERGYDNQDALLLNLAAQIETMEEYVEMMDGLEARIGGTALYDYLKSLDMKSGDNIQAVARMTDEQLQRYAERYDEKVALAKRMAEDDLAPETLADTQKAYETFAKTCDGLGVEISTSIADNMGKAVTSVTNSLDLIKQAFENFKVSFGGVDLSAFVAPTLTSDSVVYRINSETMGGTATEGTKASGTMSDVFASIVEQKNMMQKLIEMLAKFFPELIEAFDVDIFINGRVLAAELAPDMDAALGRISGNRERGR